MADNAPPGAYASAPRRMGMYVTEEAWQRFETVRKRHGLSQGIVIEKLMKALTDEQLDKILAEEGARTMTKREAMKSLSSMSEEEWRIFSAALAKAKEELNKAQPDAAVDKPATANPDPASRPGAQPQKP